MKNKIRDEKVEREFMEFIYANAIRSTKYSDDVNELEEWILAAGTYCLNGKRICLSEMKILVGPAGLTISA